MKKRLMLFVISVAMCMMSVLFVDARAQKPWTVLVYMTASFEKAPYAFLNIREMAHVGSNDMVNILVYLTIEEKKGVTKTKKLYIEKGKARQIGSSMVRDSGDVATFMEAVQWSAVDYPSDHSAIVIWDRAGDAEYKTVYRSAVKNICYSDSTDRSLSDYDFVNVLSWVKDNVRGGVPFDIIAFDTSFLATIEMAYAFSSCAHYYVASQDSISIDGFQYASWLRSLSVNRLVPAEVVARLVTTYDQEYSLDDFTSLSVVDLSLLSLLVNNINAVSCVLASLLEEKHFEENKHIIKKCVNKNLCFSFDGHRYIDIKNFYKNILKYSINFHMSLFTLHKFHNLLNDGLSLFPLVVKKRVLGKKSKDVGGLSVYFSRYSIDQLYYGLYWSKNNADWLFFLEKYIV